MLGNAVLLEWALENLIKNALDALAGSGGTSCIDGRGSRRGNVAIRVIDDGPGVSPAVRATLFEPGVTTKKGGWGVGLSLARRIVEDVHGGKLRLEPSDRGARFVMVLPCARTPSPPSASAGCRGTGWRRAACGLAVGRVEGAEQWGSGEGTIARVRSRERMNSPLGQRKVRLRGL